MMPPYKNSEYYTDWTADWTAYKAIQNIERKKSTMLIAPVKNLVPGQVYELTTNNGNSIPVLVLAASQDDTVSTTRVYDSPRFVNSQNIRVNNRMMYVDPSKMGFAAISNLLGLIGTLPPDDLIRVRRAMVSIFNLGTQAADIPAVPDAPAPAVENPVDAVENDLSARIKTLEKQLAEAEEKVKMYAAESDEYEDKMNIAIAARDVGKELLDKADAQLQEQRVEVERVKAVSATYEKLYHELLNQFMSK